MKVEVLYVSECPFHPAAVRLVKNVLVAQGVTTDIHEVLVRDEGMASELEFLGSPTIRINGQDVAGDARPDKHYGLSCRLYSGSKEIGLPPEEMVHHAVREAQQEERL